MGCRRVLSLQGSTAVDLHALCKQVLADASVSVDIQQCQCQTMMLDWQTSTTFTLFKMQTDRGGFRQQKGFGIREQSVCCCVT